MSDETDSSEDPTPAPSQPASEGGGDLADQIQPSDPVTMKKEFRPDNVEWR